MGIYRKYQNCIENLLFPVILLLYPFLTVNQGLDVADSTYSLTNFQYFSSMDGTWMVATFLSNVAGWLLMHLPFGGTLLGMKCYTTLIQSVTALMVYFGLRKKMPAPVLFLGEFIALGLCWCPSTILYNYLTYFLMTAGILFLYHGICGTVAASDVKNDDLSGNGVKQPCRGRQSVYFVAAGICLGANVAVRMPNVVQAAFILAVWYGTVLTGKSGEGKLAEKMRPLPWRKLFAVTGWCLLGYAAGFGVPLAVICIRYGISAYPDMVKTMFAMTDQAVDYKPSSMLTGMFGDYGEGLYWMAFAGICAAVTGFAFWVRERAYGAGKTDGRQTGGAVKEDARTGDFAEDWNAYRITGVIIKTAYILLLLVLLRFYWGRGMFHLRYYEYGNGSFYYPVVLLLLAVIAVAALSLSGKRAQAGQKILAAFVLLQIFLTPLGSNNDLYPIMNNLFLAAPFLVWVVSGRVQVFSAVWRQNEPGKTAPDAGRPGNGAVYDFVWLAPVTLLILFVTVQSVGSHMNFVFQDGIYGEPRDMRARTPEKAAGVYTTLENGALLEELSDFIKEEGLTGRKAITYGELPGVYYLLDMPPALSTAWPDLDSYRMTEYTRDLTALETEIRAGEKPPVIIVSSSVAAYWSDDGEAISWFGVDTEAMAADEKLRILGDFVRGYGYTEGFGNARYVVYMK